MEAIFDRENLIRVTPLVLLIIGSFHCVRSFQNREHHRKSSVALILTLSGLALIGITGLLHIELRWPVELIFGLFCCFFILVTLGSFLAVVALADLFNPVIKYRSGKFEAFTSIVLALVFIFLFASDLRSVLPNIGSTDYHIPQQPAAGMKKHTVKTVPEDTKPPSKEVQPGPAVEFPEYKLSFKPPAKPWTSLSTKRINKDACLAFLRTRPTVFSMIIAWKATYWGSLRLDDAVKQAVKNLRKTPETSWIVEENLFELNGYKGVLLVHEAMEGGKTYTYVHWIFVYGPYSYQLVTWAEKSVGREKIKQEFIDVFSGFNLMY